MNEHKQLHLHEWWHSSLGEFVTQEEQAVLKTLDHPLLGYFFVQVGGVQHHYLKTNQLISQSMVSANGDVQASIEALPFKSHSIDNLLLVHLLEYARDPHQVLRESERVLAADGKLILCRFNPWSLWGLRRLFSWQDSVPWSGHFFTQTRLADWLALLNFEIIEQHKVAFRPPFSKAKWLVKSRFFERWGKRFWPFFGGVSILVATKRTIPLTPIKQPWRQRQLFPQPSFVSKLITREKSDGPR
ncbi:MAG TPA: class I SAM-dependent methyltransferase [Methylophaga aminisulfidivorans]|uniref:Class I SAM-dependent methyltransferase n=1 Tax=Methylophaga aminisulfidivorans TaxID=230105 RepID=A0A7C1W5J8_9GAMM|nr:class I SAM-dependent methyltransferase [Methylophaga aminisulfidivorans]